MKTAPPPPPAPPQRNRVPTLKEKKHQPHAGHPGAIGRGDVVGKATHRDGGPAEVRLLKGFKRRGVDSFSILFIHRPFQKPVSLERSLERFHPQGFGWVSRRIPGKNGQVTPRKGFAKAPEVLVGEREMKRRPNMVGGHYVQEHRLGPRVGWDA